MCEGGAKNSQAAERLYGVQAQISQDQFDLWKKNYLPVEMKTIQDVNQLSDPNYIAQQTGQAKEDVAKAYTGAQQQSERRLQGLGVNPADEAYGANLRGLNLAQAGATAGAQTAMRNQLHAQSLQGQMALTQTGRNLANTGLQGIGSAAAGFGGLANSQQAAGSAGAAGLGQLAGTGLGIWGKAGFPGIAGAGAGIGGINAAGSIGGGIAGGSSAAGTAAAIAAADTAAAGTAATGMTFAQLLEAGLIAL